MKLKVANIEVRLYYMQLHGVVVFQSGPGNWFVQVHWDRQSKTERREEATRDSRFFSTQLGGGLALIHSLYIRDEAHLFPSTSYDQILQVGGCNVPISGVRKHWRSQSTIFQRIVSDK